MKRISKLPARFILAAFIISLSIVSFKLISIKKNQDTKEMSEGYDDPISRVEYEFNMLKDPKTGRIPDGVHELEMSQALRTPHAMARGANVLANTFTFQGPNNRGGRTRAIAYDVRYDGTTNKIILAGGVSGGLFKSIDDGATWVRKSPLNNLYSVTSIAQDPRPGFQDTWYYATGESLGNSASGPSVNSASTAFYLGNGIYKSTDNGETWTRLAGSNGGALETFDRRQDLISRVIVNPANGDIYFAALDAIYRSQDGGTTWASVLGAASGSIGSGMLTDIVCTSTGGRFYAAFSGFCNTTPNDNPGVWTSTTGNSGSWTKIAGNFSGTMTPLTWRADGTYGRVVLALAPSNENILYALYYNGLSYPSLEADFFVYDQSISSWTDRSANLPDEPGGSPGNDPFAVQQGYDLVIGVKPDNQNTVFIGGTNIYRSTNGFASTANTTRIGGYNDPNTAALYPNSHPDIHSIVFQPGSPSILLCGNDGGIQRTTNNLAATVAWTDICTNGYRTYQYYYVATDPRIGNTKVIGGAQDNGTTRNIGGTGSDFERIWSGDGGSVGLSNLVGGNTYEYVTWQNGGIFRRNSTAGADIGTDIRPAAATDNGLFVTLSLLDPDNTETIYYASDSSLYRNTAASAATQNNWTNLTGIQASIVDGTSPKTQISALAVTRRAYNPTTASLFIGTNEGRLYRLDDPANAAAATVPVNITGAGFPAGGYISSVAVNPRNDDTVLVTFSNYNAISVFWTGNANSATPTWQNVEGNLTLPSFRSAIIAITNQGVQYFVGTSVGLYSTTINGASPGTTSWAQEGPTDIGNAVVTSLALRAADNRLIAGTHGYGMWATSLSFSLPVNFTDFTVRAAERQNQLSWTVDNETDNRGYEVQRKYADEKDFAPIAFVDARDNGQRSNVYNFDDKLVDLGKEEVSYRLKQTDLDGKFSYSKIVSVSRKGSGKFIEYVSASQDHLLIRVNNADLQQNFRLRIYDAAGRLLKEKTIVCQTQEIDIHGLPHSVLVLNIKHPDGRSFTKKLIH